MLVLLMPQLYRLHCNQTVRAADGLYPAALPCDFSRPRCSFPRRCRLVQVGHKSSLPRLPWPSSGAPRAPHRQRPPPPSARLSVLFPLRCLSSRLLLLSSLSAFLSVCLSVVFCLLVPPTWPLTSCWRCSSHASPTRVSGLSIGLHQNAGRLRHRPRPQR